MSLSFSTPMSHALLIALINYIDSGTGPAVLMLYSGPIPATADAALTNTNVLLAQLTFTKPSAPAPSAKKISFPEITKDNEANAAGIATFFRISFLTPLTSLIQGTVSKFGESGDLTLNTTDIVVGTPVRITGASIELP